MHSNPEEAKGFLLVSPNSKFTSRHEVYSPFFRFSVPHDRLFLDALERDLKREKMGLEPTTVITGEPALSFTYDPKRSLYEQFCKAQGGYEGEGELEAAVRRADELATDDGSSDNASSADEGTGQKNFSAIHSNPTFHNMFSLFEGSPTYKQRRKKTTKNKTGMDVDRANSMDEYTSTQPRDTTRMSAADMFMAQARGEFFHEQGNERLPRSSQQLLSRIYSVLMQLLP